MLAPSGNFLFENGPLCVKIRTPVLGLGKYYLNLPALKQVKKMKKNLLFPLSGLLCFGPIMAQNDIKVIKDPNIRNKAEKISIYSASENLHAMGMGTAPTMQTRAMQTIGTSTYQLQSNASVQNRIVNNSDGTISLAYTFSANTTWSDRGTAYVYNNGTSWSALPTTRIEPVRTGWPSIMVLGDNSEVVITHNTVDENLYFSKRAVKGTGTWSHNNTIIASDAPEGNFWPRAVAGGPSNGTIHLISISNPTDGLTPPTYNTYKGQQGCITYSRSLNGGTSWDKLHEVPADHDSTEYFGFGGDSYAIDAKGNTVAYVVGGFTNDAFLMKSTDNGNTWTKTVIMAFPIPMFDHMTTDITGDGIADTINTNDGTMAVLIDDNDDVHVMFGNMRVLDDNASDDNISYFPGTSGIFYWNDITPGMTPTLIAGLEDIDGDAAINISAWGTYQNSLTSFPSMSIDATGTIHATFSAGVENTDLLSTGKCARNIYYFSSANHGTSWTDPRRIDANENSEQVWCSLARKAEANCVKMVYHVDEAPGHGTTSANADFSDNQGVTAEVVYACFDPSATGIHTVNVDDMVSIFPNPANTQFTINTIDNISKVEIFNSLGALMVTTTPNATSTNVNVANLNAGLYIVNVYNGENKISKTLIKE